MNPHPDEYELWVARRSADPVPSDFTERVMHEVQASSRPATGTWVTEIWERCLASRSWRVAVSVAAVAVGLSRLVYLAMSARLIAF